MASLSPYAFDHRHAGNDAHQNYPPMHNGSNPSFIASSTNLTAGMKDEVNENGDQDFERTRDRGRDGGSMRRGRTPSPTPSESAMLTRKGVLDWGRLLKWRFWIRREWLWYYVALVIILVAVILITVYDEQIVHWLQPTAEKIRDLPAGWIIPIAIFFIISFPPLFGHEILAILCGVVWGLWAGFGITAAGTFIGEIGNFYAFRYCCRARGEKLEKTELQYGCLAETVRRGGFKIALVARYSAIPGHFTTAVFSTCGMGIFVFSLAALLSLPKQFVTVYIGVILEQSGSGTETKRDKVISQSVLAVTILVTIGAMWYMYREMDKVKAEVIYRRRKRRQEKLEHSTTSPTPSPSSNSPYASQTFTSTHSHSESRLPFNAQQGMLYEHWDSADRGVGYAGNPSPANASERVRDNHAPLARTDENAHVGRIPTFRTEGGGGFSASGERYDSHGARQLPMPSGAAPPAIPASRRDRNDSMDTVNWDPEQMERQRGLETYKLPSIAPHSPFTGGFNELPPVSPTATGSPNPFRRNSQTLGAVRMNQFEAAVANVLPAPIPPPPQSPQAINDPPRYSHQFPNPQSIGSAVQTPYPKQQQQPLYTSQVPAPASPLSPSVLHFPPTSPASPYQPLANPIPIAHSPVQSVQTPTQQAFTYPTPIATQTQAPQHQTQTPQTPTFPMMAPSHTLPSPYPSSPLHQHQQQQYPTSGSVGAGHLQESRNETMHYTPTHSRYVTAASDFGDGDGRDERIRSPPPGYQI